MEVLQTLRNIVGKPNWTPRKAETICKQILHTCYMESQHSCTKALQRAKTLTEVLGCNFRETSIGNVMDKFEEFVKEYLEFELKYHPDGGDWGSDYTLQNLKNRLRMITSYLIAQMTPETGDCSGFLLVMSSINVDESLLGNHTKYDCASGDVAPIGSLTKVQIHKMIDWFYDFFKFDIIQEIRHAASDEEFKPVVRAKMGLEKDTSVLNYNELDIFAKFRSHVFCGPFSLYDNMTEEFPHMDPNELEEKVKKFFKIYGKNRHKSSVCTPPLHLS